MMTDAKAPLGVLNVYATPTSLKRRLGITDTTHDATLWHLLNVASRIVDGYCGRRFYVSMESKRFDVRDRNGVHLDDLIEVAQVVEDWDGDGVFERVRHRREYILYPLDANPSSPHGLPFHVMRISRRSSGRCFPSGRAAVQVTGRWGYRSHYVSLGGYVSNSGTPVTPLSGSIRVDDDTNLSAGQTILIDSEQMFVTQIGASLMNVVRGVNGTPSVSHLDASEVKVLQFPAEVIEATLLTAVDRWRRRDGIASRSDGIGGSSPLLYDPSDDVKRLLAPYRRISI